MNKLKNSVKNFLILTLTLIVTLTAVEIALNFIYPDNSMYLEGGNSVYTLKPNYSRGGRHFNSFGLRNPEFSIKKPAGKERILFIGDSFTFGATRDEYSFPRLFESMLSDESKNCEIINGGVPAYSTVHEYYFMKDRCGELDADIIALSIFVGNDIEENAVFNDVEKEGPYLISTRMRSPKKNLQKLMALINRSNITTLIKSRFFSYDRLVDRNTEQLVNNITGKFLTRHKNGSYDEQKLHFNLTSFYNSLQGRTCAEKKNLEAGDKIKAWSASEITEEQLSCYMRDFLLEGIDEQKAVGRGYKRSVFLAIQMRHTGIYYENEIKNGWKGTIGALKKIKDLSKERNQELAVVIIPDETQLQRWLQHEVRRYNLEKEEEPDFELPQKKLAKILQDLEIKYVDILPLFKEKEGSFYLKHNTHCNMQGNKVIAEAIHEMLKK